MKALFWPDLSLKIFFLSLPSPLSLPMMRVEILFKKTFPFLSQARRRWWPLRVPFQSEYFFPLSRPPTPENAIGKVREKKGAYV